MPIVSRYNENAIANDIKDWKIESTARELARFRGQSMTDAILLALKETLKRDYGLSSSKEMVEDLLAIDVHYSCLPNLDPRCDNDVLGYDEKGIPH